MPLPPDSFAQALIPMPTKNTTQRIRKAPTTAPLQAPAAPLHYRVEVADLHAHLFEVSLRIEKPAAEQEVSLPVWIPGSYLVREFAKNLQGLSAKQGRRQITVEQLDKHRWLLHCKPEQPVELRWQVCAYDTSVRTAWLDQRRGFFNGTSLLLRVHGQERIPHALEIASNKATPDWELATGLKAHAVNAKGFGHYIAADYDELVDCPVEMGHFWSGSFKACGVPHRFVVAGAPASFDGERLLRDTQKICEEEIRFWHGKGKKPPHREYVFMLNATDDNYGGLEHRNSTALICGRRDLPRLGESKASDGYIQLLGLISHEYFHTWNVKRLRPAEFARYDYDQENYTELLWFFEGFTSYYDDLFLRRAGLIDNAQYLALLTKTINQVHQTPGRHVQTVAQASFDAWVKYYRQDENTANATVSYYTKGSLVALCLDLALRREGKTTLDHVMRALWARCHAGPMAQSDVLAVLQDLTGRSWETELTAWVHSTGELPLAELLATHGVQLQADRPAFAQQLGVRVQENHSIQIKIVLRGGAAERSGFMAGDEWLGLETTDGQAWRVKKLDDVRLYAQSGRTVTALVARDSQLLRLTLDLPADSASAKPTAKRASKAQTAPALEAPVNVKLSVQDTAQAARWLGAQA